MIIKLLIIFITFLLLVISILSPFKMLALVIIINKFNVFINNFNLPKIITVSKIIGIFVALGWFINYPLKRGSAVIRYRKLNIYIFLFTLCGFISSFVAEYKIPSFLIAFRVFLMVLMVFFIQDFIRHRSRLKGLIYVVAISAGIVGLFGVLQYFAFNFLGIKIGEFDTIGNLYGPRLTGTVSNPNGFGATLMSGIPWMIFLIIIESNKKMKILLTSLLVASLISLLMTLSRTHIFGFVFFMFIFIFAGVSKKVIRSRYLVNYLVVIFITIVIFYSMPKRVYERLIDYTFSKYDVSRQTRELIIKKGLFLFLKAPILGIGYDNIQRTYVALYPIKQGSHDFISMVLASTGILGFSFLIIAIYLSLSKYVTIMKNIKFYDTYWKFFIIISFAGFVEVLMTFLGNTIILQRIFWIYLTMPFIIEKLLLKEKDEENSESYRAVVT